ncbi:MAG: hypothetical protein RLZZ528_2558 [Pseudomonadota bacterium]
MTDHLAQTPSAQARLPSHEVLNQPPPRQDHALWQGDLALRSHATLNGADPSVLTRLAGDLGTPEMAEKARAATRNPPELRSFDRGGRRLDEVVFHPAYHDFLSLGLGAGYAALPWEGATGGHVTHAAMVYLHSQVEPGTCCPMTMTYAALPVIVRATGDAPGLSLWRDRLMSRNYDPSVRVIASKSGATLGMAMTEKQGGSDLRATTTKAEETADGWRLTGHKWFCSAPMSDGFLTLAQTPQGITCFLVPRWLDAGRNAIHLMRLKDKLGNRANASAEIEYHGALGIPVGEPGRGIATILQMVHHTRLDTALAPAGLMRAALAEALHWAGHRTAFQLRLIDQPLMALVLASAAIETEAALALGLRVARAFDGGTDQDRAFARVGVALAKFLANKRCVPVVAEAMEALGGMGYVEDTPLPMLYREAPLNGIWEGSGNVICLDILRTLAREPAAAAALQTELGSATGQDARYDAALAAFRERWNDGVPEPEARAFCVRAATLLAAAQLLRHAPQAVASGYLSIHLDEGSGIAGCASDIDAKVVLARSAAPGGGD